MVETSQATTFTGYLSMRYGDVDPQVERGYGYAISDRRALWRWENRKGDSSYVRDSKDFSGLKINLINERGDCEPK